MPEVFQCRLALCPYEEMAAQITGTIDATESGSCIGWYVTNFTMFFCFSLVLILVLFFILSLSDFILSLS